MPINETGEFLGVPEAALTALGALAVAAGRLEHVIHTMLLDLGGVPGKRQAKDCLKEIRQSVGFGLPRHARCTGAEIEAWIAKADTVLDQRNVHFHSAASKVMGEPAIDVSVHLRSGERNDLDASQIWQLTERIATRYREASDLDLALRRTPRPGVFLSNTVYAGDWLTPICSTDHGGVDMPRPTVEELDEWWSSMGPWCWLDDGKLPDAWPGQAT